jgi:hypothetical protein
LLASIDGGVATVQYGRFLDCRCRVDAAVAVLIVASAAGIRDRSDLVSGALQGERDLVAGQAWEQR